MKQPKAYIIINSLNGEELKILKKFIASPLYVTRSSVADLCRYCMNMPSFPKDTKFDFKKCFQVLFPNEVFDKSRITKLFSELFKVLQQYIVVLSNRTKSHDADMEILSWYNEKNLSALFEEKSKEIVSSYEEGSKIDRPELYNHYRYDLQQSIYQSKNDKRIGDVNYQNTLNRLDLFYIIQKLSGLCLMRNRERVSHIEYEKPLREELLAFLPNSGYVKNPYVLSYYRAYLMLSNPGVEQYYNDLAATLVENKKVLPQIILRELYVYMENESRNVFKKDEEFYGALFTLYKEQVETETIFYKGDLLSNVLKNITVVSVKTKHLEWLNDFLEKNKRRIIPKKNAESVYHYCKAEIYFAQKQYNEAIENLTFTNEQDVFMSLSIKRLYIKIWFEMEEWETFESHINAYRVYLSRHKKIDENRKGQERTFTNWIYKLYRSIVDPNEENISEHMVKELSFSDKSWIISSMQNLV